MKLNAQLKEDTGYSWVMARMEPASPFGHALVRSPHWYGPGEKDALEAELSRVEQLREEMDRDGSRTDALIHILSEFHDIRNSLKRPTSAPMDEVELFEVKHFLIHLERLAQAYAQIRPLEGLTIRSMDKALALLDPSGRRLPPSRWKSPSSLRWNGSGRRRPWWRTLCVRRRRRGRRT